MNELRAGELLQMVERRAVGNLMQGETYRDKNGILRCCRCNEPRRAFVEATGREMPVTCSCFDKETMERKRQGSTAFAKEEAEKCVLYDRSYNDFTFTRDNTPDSIASRQCRSYAEHWQEMESNNFGLILSGTLGVGKSFLAGCITNELRARGVSAMIVSVSRYIAAMRSARDPLALSDELNSFRLVALVDLGTEARSDYVLELIENFVNDRILAKRPLIITTNLTGKELMNPTDLRLARLYDRLLVMCPRPVILTGQSRRVDERQQRAAQMRSILEA